MNFEPCAGEPGRRPRGQAQPLHGGVGDEQRRSRMERQLLHAFGDMARRARAEPDVARAAERARLIEQPIESAHTSPDGAPQIAAELTRDSSR